MPEVRRANLSSLHYDPNTGLAVGMWLFTLTDGSTCLPRHCGRVVDGLAIDPVPGEALRYIIAAGMPVGEVWRVDADLESMASGSEPEDEEVESIEEEEIRLFEDKEAERAAAMAAEAEARFVSEASAMIRSAETVEELGEALRRIDLFAGAIGDDHMRELRALFEQRLSERAEHPTPVPAADPPSVLPEAPVLEAVTVAEPVAEPVTAPSEAPSEPSSKKKGRKS